MKILVFACKWCGLIGADGAGKKRIQLPSQFRVIPVECAALVEPDAVIRAFASGMTGVAVLGCHLGGCRFNGANHAAIKRLEILKTLLDSTGIDGKRLLISFGMAHEDHQYAEVVKAFFEQLEAMPSTAVWMR